MTAFQQEITKILLDKFLLAVVAAGFGFYLSRLLENYRAKNAYKLALYQHYVEACRDLASLVIDHHDRVIALWETIKLAATKHPLSAEEMKPALDYPTAHAELSRRTRAILPFMTFDVADAVIAYLTETLKVAAIARLEIPDRLPTDQSLKEALRNFLHALGSTIYDGPYEHRKREPTEV